VDWETWLVNLTANDVLGNEVQQDQSERHEAKAWLQDLLAAGPVPVKEIQKDAKAAGLAWMTVRRAKEALSVITQKSTYHGGWEWRLEDPQYEDAHPVDAQVSTFEQTTKNTIVSRSRGHEDVHDMSTFDAFQDDGEVRL
jgi:hypothetical protein